MSYIPSIDISEYQGLIDWTKIGEPIVMIKMSGGDAKLYTDKYAAHNYDGATGQGKAVGGYHFAGGTDPVAEANYFLAAMSPLAENDVYALDWEIQHPDPVGWCLSFMQTIHDKIGVWPLLYINLATLNAYDWSPVLQHCGLWLADWAVSPEAIIPTHHVYVMQQYDDGPWCDHDAWFGTLDQFKAYGYHKPETVPATPTVTPQPPVSPIEPSPVVPDPQPVPEPTPTPKPAQTAPTQPTAPKVVVPEPTYYRVWDLLLAIFKKLLHLR